MESLTSGFGPDSLRELQAIKLILARIAIMLQTSLPTKEPKNNTDELTSPALERLNKS